jgi:Leucine-rich repeat (LRR) protein
MQTKILIYILKFFFIQFSYQKTLGTEDDDVTLKELNRDIILFSNDSDILNSTKTLNLTNSNYFYINKTTFEGLINLKELNLSFNIIKQINISSNLNNLLILDLKKNDISKTESKNFFILDNMIRLDLSDNNLQEFDSKNIFSSNNQLEELYLSYNNLKSFDFSGLKKLQVLDLKNNNISKIGGSESFVTIVTLDLSENNLEEFNSKIIFPSKINQLRELSLSKNHLKSFDFLSLNHLEILKINSNNLNIQLESLSLLLPKTLTILNLSFNNVTMSQNETSNSFINLRSLDLTKTNILKIEKQSFSGLLKLEKLLLNHNKGLEISNGCFYELKKLAYLDLTDIGLKSLNASNLFNKDNNLTVLILIQNDLNYLDEYSFKDLRNLKILNLKFNQIKHILPKTFDELIHLKYLNLYSNKLKKIYKTSFDSLINLEELILSHNQLVYYDDWLRNLKKLKSLYIDDSIFDIKLLDGTKNARNLHEKFQNILKHLDQNEVFQDFSLDLIENKTENNDLIIYEDEPTIEINKIFNKESIISILDTKNPDNLIKLFNLNKSELNKLFESFLKNNLKLLNLTNSGLHYITDETFFETNNLKVLDISCNNLISFNSRKYFHSYNQLEELFINNNKLNSFDFSRLKILKKLVLSENKLKIKSWHITDRLPKSLVYLDLSENSLIQIESGTFINFTNLKFLKLNKIDSLNVNMIMVKYLTNLEELLLNGNKNCWQKNIGIFVHAKKLTNLELSNVGLDSFNCEKFNEDNSLKRLSLESNIIESFDKISLECFKNLTYLSLKSNSLKSFKEEKI